MPVHQWCRAVAAMLPLAGLLLASDPSKAATLLDFRYPILITADPVPADPFFDYYVYSPTLGSRFGFRAPLVAGPNVFDLSGEPLAITIAALTDGSLQAAYDFIFGHGGDLEFGIGFRDEFDFFIGQATDLQGFDVDAVRITWDVCLQPIGTEGCAGAYPGQIGYTYDLTFQAFGDRSLDIPEPGTLALLGAGLLLFGMARHRRA